MAASPQLWSPDGGSSWRQYSWCAAPPRLLRGTHDATPAKISLPHAGSVAPGRRAIDKNQVQSLARASWPARDSRTSSRALGFPNSYGPDRRRSTQIDSRRASRRGLPLRSPAESRRRFELATVDLVRGASASLLRGTHDATPAKISLPHAGSVAPGHRAGGNIVTRRLGPPKSDGQDRRGNESCRSTAASPSPARAPEAPPPHSPPPDSQHRPHPHPATFPPAAPAGKSPLRHHRPLRGAARDS